MDVPEPKPPWNEHDAVQTRESLISRVKNLEDEGSWKEFFDLYWKLVFNVAFRAGLNRADCEEVVQEVFLDLARKLPEFKYDRTRGSFKTWLWTLATWRIRDHFRRRLPEPADVNMEEITGPSEIDWEDDWRRNLADAAMNRVREQVNAKHFQLFDLTYRKGLSTTAAAKALGMPVATAYLARHRVKRRIQEEIERLQRKYERDLSPAEKESF